MDDDFQIGDLVIFVDAAFDNRYGIERDDSLGIIIYNKGATATLTSTKDPAFAKAKDYVQKGGKLDAIKKKYKLSAEVEKALTTL